METLGLARSLIDDLREQITVGKFAPGEKINEIKIASDLGISRSPLREALRVLENECLVVNIPRKGSFVTEIWLEDLNEIYQMREMIECYAIDLLKEKKIRDLPEVALCADEAAGFKIPSEADSAKKKLSYITGLAEYHLKLVESTGNKRLSQLYRTIHSNINRYVFFNAFMQGAAEHRIDEHYKILDYIKQGKYGKAKAVAQDHIRLAAEQLRERITMQEPYQAQSVR